MKKTMMIGSGMICAFSALPLAQETAGRRAAVRMPQTVPPTAYVWADFDGDGRQDLYSLAGAARPDALLRNQGAGDFEDFTSAAGLAGRRSIGAAPADYDGDGDSDLLLLGEDGRTRLFQNIGELAFEEVDAGWSGALPENAANAHWGDLDEDGLLDLALESAAGEPRFFRQGPEGSFAELTLGLGFDAGASTPIWTVARGSNLTGDETPAPGSTALDQGHAKQSGARGTGAGDDQQATIGSVTMAGGQMAGMATICAGSIEDQATGNCLQASSVPELGKLFPLSTDLLVQPNGLVGIGSTSSLSKLTVAAGPNNQGITSFGIPAIRGEKDDLTWAELGTEDDFGRDYGIRATGSYGAALFEGSVECTSFMTLEHSLAIGHTTIAGAYDIWVQREDDAVIRLEADTDNQGEFDHPQVLFSQDGGAVTARVGMDRASNALFVGSRYEFGEMFFDLVDTTSSNNAWKWVNTTTLGMIVDTEARLTEDGDLQLDGTVSSPAADVAELYPLDAAGGIVARVEPGDVVVFAPSGMALRRAQAGAPGRVAGVVSSHPGLVLGGDGAVEDDDFVDFPGTDEDRFVGSDRYRVDRMVLHEIENEARAPLALTGRVPCKVSGEGGPIRPGDLLTVSSISGHAKKASGSGTVIGTALEAWNGSTGKILVFINVGWFDAGSETALSSGRGRLQGGVARIDFSLGDVDPETVAIHLTAVGSHQDLFVGEIDAHGFVVVGSKMEGGFSWSASH